MVCDLALVPVTQRQAWSYIALHHRHHPPPAGDLYRVGAVAKGELEMVAVAVVGRPVSRQTQHQEPQTCELLRLCVREGAPRNTASFLLGACRRAAWALGYTRLITYTLASESGTSMRAAGYRLVGSRPARSWNTLSRPRVDRHVIEGRLLWEVVAT